MKKSIITLILCALTSVGTVRAYDFSAVTTSGHTLYYNIESAIAQTVEVTYPNPDPVYSYGWNGFVKPVGDLVVDDSVVWGGVTYHVDAIGEYAFYACNGLTSVTLPNSVAHIRNAAFQGCTALNAFNFPAYLTTIGNNAFSWCTGFTTLTLPASVNSIGSSAFSDCSNLSSINIPPLLTEIAPYTFHSCSSLTTVQLPDSVHHIRSSAFGHCTSLTSINMPPALYSIEANAFFNCILLDSITIPQSVNTLQTYAFSFCSGLTTVHYNARRVNNAGSVFQNDTNITTVTIGDGVLIVPTALFNGCYKITEIMLPNTLTTISSYAFQGCRGLRSVVIPNSVTVVGISAFEGCSGLTAVTLPDSLATIKENTFLGCSSLASITIPGSVTAIGAGAFCGCTSLSGINLEESLRSIGDSAFKGCGLAGELLIPWRMTTIGSQGFMGCTGIESITSRCMSVPTTGSMAFEGIGTDIPVNIPCGKLESYSSSWPYFHNFHEMELVFQATSDNPEQGTVDVEQAPSCSYHGATVRAIPNPGFRFDHWSNGDNHNPTSVVVIDTMTLTAFFDVDTTTGIPDAGVSTTGINVYAQGDLIVVEGASHEPIRIYDVAGRLIATTVSRPFNKGVYLVQVGTRPAIKVAVR